MPKRFVFYGILIIILLPFVIMNLTPGHFQKLPRPCVCNMVSYLTDEQAKIISNNCSNKLSLCPKINRFEGTINVLLLALSNFDFNK